MIKLRSILLFAGLVILCLICAGCGLVPDRTDHSLPVPTPSDESVILSAEIPVQNASETQVSPVSKPSVSFTPLAQSSPNCQYGGEFNTIEALRPDVVRFKLCRPDVAFLSKIAFPTFGILPVEFLTRTGGGGMGSELLLHPVGSGPYQVLDWQPGQSLRFGKYSGYWENKPDQVSELVFRWNLDEGQRMLEIQSGTASGVDNLSSQDYFSLISDADRLTLFREPLSIAYLGMNNSTPPFDIDQVRLAISMAIDRQKIMAEVFPPGYKLANFFTPCVIPNGCVGQEWYAFDPEKARELISLAGYPEGFETQLYYRTVIRGYLPDAARLAKALQTQLKENLNITVQLMPVDTDEFLVRADDGLLPGLFLLGWGADYPDVSNFLNLHFGDQAPLLFGNKQDDVLKALRSAQSLAAEQERRPYYEQASNVIRQHAIMVPLAHGSWIGPDGLIVAFQKTVQNAQVSPMGFERFADFSFTNSDAFVWVQSNEPLSLHCADETDVDTLRACSQVVETLYRYVNGSVQVEPALAESCVPDEDLIVWTCNLRNDVRFHDGSLLDANDVVASFLVQWDAANPLHKGRTGEFAYFKAFWGEFLNANHER